MANSFIYRLKNKKSVFVFFCICFTALVATPHPAYAALTNIDTIIASISIFIPKLLLYIFIVVCDILSSIMLFILGPGLKDPITSNPVFMAAWFVVRDWGNMLIVIGLIGIAIATILDFEKYRAQKLLAPIILVALLINFSGVFVGAIIDASNITTLSVMQGGISINSIKAKISSAGLLVVDRAEVELYNSNRRGWTDLFQGIIRVISAIILVAIIYAMVSFVFIYMAVLMLVRYALLSFLFIVSPLAFAFFAFPLPAAKKLWLSWWDHFIKWSFVGFGIAFAVRISGEILTRGIQAGGTTLNTGTIDVNNPANSTLIILLAVVLTLLFIGIKMTTKAVGPIASAIMGATAGAFTWSLGTGMKIGGSLAGSGFGGAAGFTGQAMKALATRKREDFEKIWQRTKAGSKTGSRVGGLAAGGIAGGIEGAIRTKSLKGAGKTALEEAGSGAKIGAGGAGLIGGVGKVVAGGGIKEIGKGAREGVESAKESYNWWANKFDATMEGLGIEHEGTSDRKDKERKREKLKSRIDNYKDLDPVRLAEIEADASRSDADKAAAAEVLRQKGRIGLVGAGLSREEQTAKQAEMVKRAEANGFSGEDYIKIPELAGLMKPMIDEIMKRNGWGEDKRDEAVAQVRRELYQRDRDTKENVDNMSKKDLIDALKKAIENKNADPNYKFSSSESRMYERAIKEEWLDDATESSEGKAKFADDIESYFGANVRKAVGKQDILVAGELEKLKLTRESGGLMSAAEIDAAGQKEVEKQVGKLTESNLIDMSPKSIEKLLKNKGARNILLDQSEKLKRVILKAGDATKKAVTDAVITSIADDVDSINTDELVERIYIIPKPDIRNTFDTQDTIIKDKISDKLQIDTARREALEDHLTELNKDKKANKKEIEAIEEFLRSI